MTLTAKQVPFSSVVGSSVTLHEDGGRVVAQLAILLAGGKDEQVKIAEFVTEAINNTQKSGDEAVIPLSSGRSSQQRDYGHSFPNYARFATDVEAALGDHLRSSEVDASYFWGSLANILWCHRESGEIAFFSFREAGAYVASIRGDGTNYMDWYCNVPSEFVPEFVRNALDAKGWEPKVAKIEGLRSIRNDRDEIVSWEYVP